MKTMIYLSAALLGAGIVYLFLRKPKDTPLSQRWLDAQARMDERQGWEGVCWRWPYRGNDAA